jgi:hypothetical protein
MPPRAKRKGSVDASTAPTTKKGKPETIEVKDEPVADSDQDRVLAYLQENGKVNKR